MPHRYYEADTADVVVASAPFGRLRTRVVSCGPHHAPPLLLVHGLMTTSYSWCYLLERLGDRFLLIAPDPTGAGATDAPPATRRITAAALATFLGELQLVCAREDPLVAPKNGARLHELAPAAELHWVERSSHFVQVDSPDRLTALLVDFLDR